MPTQVYQINKGVSRPVEFKGIKGQYIMYMGLSLVAVLILFAVLYVIGINIYICLSIIIPSAAAAILAIQKLSHKYGEHGLFKKSLQKKLPGYIKANSRKPFIQINTDRHEK